MPEFGADALSRAVRHVLSHPGEESGGLLATSDMIVVSEFHPLRPERPSAVSYDIDSGTAARVISRWADGGICFCGVLHSHPNGSTRLSAGDRKCAEGLLSAMPFMPFLLFPVIALGDDGCSLQEHLCALDGGGLSVDDGPVVALGAARA